MQRCSFFAVLTLLFSATGFAHDSTSLGNHASQDLKCSIKGKIVDALSGATVVGAAVTARGPGPTLKASTDSNGQYAFDHIPEGEYRVSAYKDGYGKGPSGESTPLRRVRLRVGQQLSGVDFSLTPAAVISGRVLDNANRPLANVRISVLGAGFRHGRPMWWTQTTIRTNDRGEYRIPDLAPGKWFLEARLPMLSVQRPKARRSISGTAKGRPLVIFYPGVSEIDAAEALFLTSGEERDLQDIRVPAVDTSCVSADLPANGPAKVHVSLVAHTPGWRTMVGSGLAASPGVIEICGVPWGVYYLQLTASGESGQALGFNQTSFEVGGKDVHLGAVSCDPPLTVPGKMLVIEDSGSEKLAKDRLQVGMEAYDRLFGYAGENAGAQVQPSGEFILPKLLNDLYWRVAVMGLPDGYYVKSALMAGRDPRREPMHAGSGELLVTIASDGASLRGKVVDRKEEPVPDALVVLAPSSLPPAGSPELITTQVADQAGEFEFRSVSPGDYQLIALLQFTLGAGENPAFVRKYFTKETAVSLQPRQSKEVTVIVADR